MTANQAKPLSAVDRVEGTTAYKVVSARDPYLSGHYPGWPVYPGVFTVETVLQAARLVLAPQRVELAAVVSLGLTAPLHPGDRLTAHLDITGDRVRAKCVRDDGTPAARMTLELRGAGARTA
ncbi:hypothetical protein [Actinokineospora diospyrosa]|uniref:3-hydroxyacyl-[acyl-carrier-protein] dehydratase n=1 Tax=Actinokineospora diospyrosa TaxID=103728 RepID=A0ABT1I9Z4_9PSEU|nr:hypothetical protein [Actinokineospora diospyrosa]MCP2269407.1 3-hydroxyacyl-[acyl-carrier-protein] dehydratase [Actinokineospora diospyrosa]